LKTKLFLTLAAAALLFAGAAHAQVLGQFTGAETLPVNGHLIGAYLHSSENVVGLLGQLRLSFYPDVDFGFQGGLSRQEFESSDRTTVTLGADLKYAVAKPSERLPLAIAIGGALALETGDDLSLITVGPTAVASHTFATGTSSSITPYAGLGLMFMNANAGNNKSSDLSMPLRFGGDFRITPQVDIVGELQVRVSDDFNDDVGFSVGVNLPF
jgi:hypothetical protein